MVSGGSSKQLLTPTTGAWSRMGVHAYCRLKSWVMPWRFEGAKEWRERGTGHSPSHSSWDHRARLVLEKSALPWHVDLS